MVFRQPDMNLIHVRVNGWSLSFLPFWLQGGHHGKHAIRFWCRSRLFGPDPTLTLVANSQLRVHSPLGKRQRVSERVHLDQSEQT